MTTATFPPYPRYSCWNRAKSLLLSPCRTAMPPELAVSPWLQQVGTGPDPALVWDGHVRREGGIRIGPQLSSWQHLVQYLQRVFNMNGAGGRKVGGLLLTTPACCCRRP